MTENHNGEIAKKHEGADGGHKVCIRKTPIVSVYIHISYVIYLYIFMFCSTIPRL